MQRAIQLTLFAIFLSTVLVGLGIGYYRVQQISENVINRELKVVHDGVVRRFRMFDVLLLQEEEVMEARLSDALPQLAERLLADPKTLETTTLADLRALSETLRVDNVYVIDASTKIIATDFEPDLGFELGTISTEFRTFLERLIGTGDMVINRLTMSSKTGILTKYGYFSPKGSDRIAEVSIQVRKYLARERSPELMDFLFRQFFLEVAHNRPSLTGLDIHMVNKIARFSLFDRNTNLPDDIAVQLYDTDTVVQGEGGVFTVYSKLVMKDTRLATADFLAITTHFDFSDQIANIRYEVFLLVAMMLGASAVTYALATRLAVKHVVRRVESVRGGLQKISQGYYEASLEVTGQDELNDIVNDVNTVRKRILSDLKDREHQAAEMEQLAEEQTILRGKAEAADKTKSEFLSTVSHELRTPLTAVRGALGLLEAQAVGSLPDELQKLVDVANRNGERLGLLIDDILDLEKIQSGRMDFHIDLIEVGELIEQAAHTNMGYAGRFQVRLKVKPGPESLYLLGDMSRMQQVLANLISNAAKFSNPGDDVTLSWQEQPLRHNGESVPGVRISVTDHGVGIPKTFYEKIFQPFSQADASTTRAVGGTGLGLSISKVIIEHHAGALNFESEEGKGTVFYFDLPLAKVETQ